MFSDRYFRSLNSCPIGVQRGSTMFSINYRRSATWKTDLSPVVAGLVLVLQEARYLDSESCFLQRLAATLLQLLPGPGTLKPACRTNSYSSRTSSLGSRCRRRESLCWARTFGPPPSLARGAETPRARLPAAHSCARWSPRPASRISPGVWSAFPRISLIITMSVARMQVMMILFAKFRSSSLCRCWKISRLRLSWMMLKNVAQCMFSKTAVSEVRMLNFFDFFTLYMLFTPSNFSFKSYCGWDRALSRPWSLKKTRPTGSNPWKLICGNKRTWAGLVRRRGWSCDTRPHCSSSSFL